MAKRRKSSPLEDMLDLVARLPWWGGVALGVAGYLILHRLAAPISATGVQPGQVAGLMQQAVIKGLATAGQYIVPIICFAGAALSAWRRKQRQSLVSDVAQAQSVNALDGMSWREFELLVGEAFRLQGFRVSETGGGGPDGGVDLTLTKGTEKFLVQCKQWKAFKVGVDVVRELYGVMAARGATGGFVVTSGRFTAEAKAFAEGRNVQLVDGPRLFSMIKQAKQSMSAAVKPPDKKPAIAQLAAANEPACPQCGSGMVMRTARKGANAGGAFWGCSNFPSCRGVRQAS